ncbi:MAG TPA: DUF2393 family protein [Terracidiphilus sp.]|nr:DUF2393 family protein [Terracidiphilus sp.]
MSTGPNLDLMPRQEARERNWVPLVIAAFVVIVVAAIFILALQRDHPSSTVTPLSAAPDSYAASLPISGLVMSESTNFVGSKITYVDGTIANTGSRTVRAITVQVLFRTFANEVTQNETQPMQWIRTRDPYIDVEPVSAAPLAPGQKHAFRLIFDGVSPDWNGAYPEIRVLHVDFQ